MPRCKIESGKENVESKYGRVSATSRTILVTMVPGPLIPKMPCTNVKPIPAGISPFNTSLLLSSSLYRHFCISTLLHSVWGPSHDTLTRKGKQKITWFTGLRSRGPHSEAFLEGNFPQKRCLTKLHVLQLSSQAWQFNKYWHYGPGVLPEGLAGWAQWRGGARTSFACWDCNPASKLDTYKLQAATWSENWLHQLFAMSFLQLRKSRPNPRCPYGGKLKSTRERSS